MTTTPLPRTPSGAGAEFDLVVRAGCAITPAGQRPVEVGVRDGVIAAIDDLGTGWAARKVVDLADDEVLLPGLVDSHVHINEPGRTDWEGFASATRAAAAGGVTTIVDMPLNSLPPTTDVPALAAKRARAEGSVFVDVGFWGGAVPGNTARLPGLHQAGVFGFKCFLLDSGVPEFGYLDPGELEADLALLTELGAMMIVHAEDGQIIRTAPAPGGPRYADFLGSRPPQAESAAIAVVIDAAARTGARVHILHLSDAGALPMIARAREQGVAITVETCPHYLTLAAEQVPDGATAFKCCPPIRDQHNQDGLWQGLADGLIDIIVTDHSPATPGLKTPSSGDFHTAWGGIASLQLGLAAVWTEAGARGFTLADVARWMSAGPARFAGLDRKGGIEIGRHADLAVFAPEESFTVDAARLYHKNPVTAYAGHHLQGVVRTAILRGRAITDVPHGMLLRRGES